jgi:hypothetical protein
VLLIAVDESRSTPMSIFLILLCVLFLFLSRSTFVNSKSAIHEIEALLFLLIAVLLLIGAAIVRELKAIRQHSQHLMRESADEDAEADEDQEEEEQKEASMETSEEKTTKRKCPSCGRKNGVSVTRCDCGWSLAMN